MQNLDTDMDDLLRRASEAYPLKEDRDRWEEIASKIAAPARPEPNESPQLKRTYKALPVLLTLLFLALSLLLTEKSMLKNSTALPDRGRFPDKRNSEQILLQEKPKIKEVNTNISGTAEKTVAGTNASPTTSEKEKTHSFQNQSKSVKPTNDFGYHHETTKGKLSPATLVIQKSSPGRAYSQLKIFPENPANEVAAKNIAEEIKGGLRKKSSYKRIYVGGTVAMSFSTVKNSGMDRSGYSLGLLVGYRTSHNISLETGLSYCRKFYSSKGEYFDMNEMGSAMPSGMQIMEVEGSNHVFEIPLHLKYDFNAGRRSHFFSTIGFSSFLMTQEKNQYDLMTNGVSQKMTGTYKNNRQYMAASLDLSIGYEKSLGVISMRLEPYVQIPLKGVGIGKLPVTSYGWRLGILQ